MLALFFYSSILFSKKIGSTIFSFLFKSTFICFSPSHCCWYCCCVSLFCCSVSWCCCVSLFCVCCSVSWCCCVSLFCVCCSVSRYCCAVHCCISFCDVLVYYLWYATKSSSSFLNKSIPNFNKNITTSSVGTLLSTI